MEHRPGRVCRWQLLKLPCVWGSVRGRFRESGKMRAWYKNDEKNIVQDKQRSEEAVRSLSDVGNRTRCITRYTDAKKKM